MAVNVLISLIISLYRSASLKVATIKVWKLLTKDGMGVVITQLYPILISLSAV